MIISFLNMSMLSSVFKYLGKIIKHAHRLVNIYIYNYFCIFVVTFCVGFITHKLCVCRKFVLQTVEMYYHFDLFIPCLCYAAVFKLL